LDGVVDYLPSPVDVPSVEGIVPKTGAKEEGSQNDAKRFSALVFKVVTDPYIGRLTYIRTYSGKASRGQQVYNCNRDRVERLSRILLMHANKREDTEELEAGEIAAVVGLKHSVTGDTISDKAHPILLESMSFPEPVIAVAIEPKTKVDQDKLGDALSKLTFEDPTFKVKQDTETGQTIISGMGELHLEILVDRMLREFKIEANVGRPQVAYKETITEAIKTEGKFIRQSGGRGQYGHVIMEMEPLEPGESFAFENGVVGGDIPKEYIPSIEAGVKEAMENGVIAGYPMVGIGVRLLGGTFHDVDSSEIAFKAAASMALRDGAKKAGPVLLEPIMDVEVVVPEQYLGDVIGDLKAHRGHIEGIAPRSDGQIVAATVPLGDMFGYATRLRSITQGRAIYTMQFAKYNPVPEDVAKKLVAGAVA